MQQGDRRRVETIGGDEVAGEGRSGERIVDGHEVVIDGGGGKIAVALGNGGDGGNALAAVAIAGVLEGEIDEPLVIGDEFGNADRSADIEGDGFALHIGLGNALSVEGEGRGVQNGVAGSNGERSGIRGPHAPAIAEGGELAVEGTATAAASASACSTTTAAAATAASSTAATSAATAAASTTTTASTAAGRSEAAAGIGAETGGCARRAESAHAESIGAARDAEAQVREAGVHDGAAAGTTGTAGSATTGEAVQALLIVGSLLQAAADAAADGQVVGVGDAEVGHLFGAGSGDFLRAGLSGGDVDVGKSGLAGLSVSAASAAVCAIGSAAGSALAAAGLGLLAGGWIRPRRSGSGSRSGGLGSGRRCGGGARRGGFDCGCGRSGSTGGLRGFAVAGHFEGPIALSGRAAIDFRVQRPEAQHLNLNFPLAGREIELVAAILVGISDQLCATLARSDGGAGNKLIGGANGAAMLGGKETGATGQAGEEEEESHGNLCT